MKYSEKSMATARYLDIRNRTFGHLRVIRLANKRSGDKHARWLCRCECGTELTVAGTELRRGKARSCGCSRDEYRYRPHGHAIHSGGRKKDRTYTSYIAAKGRCQNKNDPSYARYGGRGVRFRFRNFVHFLREVGERPNGKTIDRYPNRRGNYESGNVRWATPKEQAQNR